MKAVFVSYNQALNDRVMKILDQNYARGFTKWELTHGRGSVDGEPHFASHTWPAMNSTILTIVDDSKVERLLKAFRTLDAEAPQHGLRAFVWDVTDAM